jgi:hypothetical protein
MFVARSVSVGVLPIAVPEISVISVPCGFWLLPMHYYSLSSASISACVIVYVPLIVLSEVPTASAVWLPVKYQTCHW